MAGMHQYHFPSGTCPLRQTEWQNIQMWQTNMAHFTWGNCETNTYLLQLKAIGLDRHPYKLPVDHRH